MNVVKHLADKETDYFFYFKPLNAQQKTSLHPGPAKMVRKDLKNSP